MPENPRIDHNLDEPARDEMLKELIEKGISYGYHEAHDGRDTSRLEPFREELDSIFLSSIYRVSQDLPVKDVSIKIFDYPDGVIPEYGVGGFTNSYDEDQAKSLISIKFDPESDKFQDSLKNGYIDKTIRHELQHACRNKDVGNRKNLLDSLVTEGLSTAYEIEESEDEVSEYGSCLSADEIEKWITIAEKEYDSSSYNHAEWFFGEGKVPRWTGYAIGYHLIRRFLDDNPNKKITDIYNLSSEKFIRK